MGAIDDYYKRQQEMALRLAQQQELARAQEAARAQGLDPALAGQPGQAAPSAVSVAAGGGGGAPAVDPSAGYGDSGYYVPTNTGSVSSPDRNLAQIVFGQDTTHVDPSIIASLPDAGDVAALNAANVDYQKQHDAWAHDVTAYMDFVKSGNATLHDLTHMKENVEALKAREPKKPDILPIQHASDRNRLINTVGGAYTGLISQLQDSAAGRGPSTALSTYRAAADDASSRNYGIAASSKGTGGQRAALFQAALGQNAQDAQGAARQSAIIGAQEQNQARAALNSSLQGLTNVYGTSNLLGDTSHQQDRNQDSYNHAIDVNTGIAEGNANRATETVKSTGQAGATALSHV